MDLPVKLQLKIKEYLPMRTLRNLRLSNKASYNNLAGINPLQIINEDFLDQLILLEEGHDKDILIRALYKLLVPVEKLLRKQLFRLNDYNDLEYILEYFERLKNPEIFFTATERYFELVDKIQDVEDLLIGILEQVVLIIWDKILENDSNLTEFTILDIIGHL